MYSFSICEGPPAASAGLAVCRQVELLDGLGGRGGPERAGFLRVALVLALDDLAVELGGFGGFSELALDLGQVHLDLGRLGVRILHGQELRSR